MSGIVTIVQARTASTRLPGKVLLPLGGRTVLEVMLERVAAARLVGRIAVATTTSIADRPIVEAAARAGVPCWCGHPTDLLDRHRYVAMACRATHVVKIPSDCPLIDPRAIDDVLDFYLASGEKLDYASNLHPATRPDGNDVEVMRFDALDAAWREAERDFEREHTTPFLWNRPDRFRLGNVVWGDGRDCARTHRVVLDYAEDYDVIRDVHAALAPVRRFYGADEIVRFLDAHPEIAFRNARHRGVSWYRDHLPELPGLKAVAMAS